MRDLSSNEIREIAILFKKKLIANNQDIFELVPIDLLYGYYDSDYEWFINKDSKSYAHFIGDEEQYVFGFNKPVNEYLDKYKNENLTLNDIYLKILEDVKNKKYLCNFEEGDKYIVHIKEKDTNKTYYSTDLICDNYNALADAYVYSVDGMETEEEIRNIAQVAVSNSQSEIKVDTIKLYKTLKEHIIGQDEGLKTIVGTIWKNYNSDSKASNILIIGPTGVGKTETARIISEVIGVPFTIVSANQFSQVGFVGDNTTDILKNLLVNAKYDVKKAERGIVVIDELDKIATNDSDRITVATKGVQNELLKLIEDGSYVVNNKEISTKNITFIALGAFEEIAKDDKSLGFNNDITVKTKDYNEITYDDLEAYGINGQILGRLPVLVAYNNLSEEDFISIMKSSKSSIILELKKIYASQGIDLVFDDEILSIIAKESRKLKHGVRGIETIVTNIMKDINFAISQNPNKFKEVVITDDTIKDCKKYILR